MLKLVDGTELTEEVKEAFKKSITSAYIKMNDGTILSSANYLKTIKLEDFRYNEETGNIIGEAISKRVTLGLFNQENALNIENKEFELIIGTQLSLNEENNFYDIADVLLMSKDMTINDDDTVTATFDNTDGTKAQYLNLFTNVSGFLGTSEKYFAVLEIINVTGTGAITITDSAVELEPFSNLENGLLLKYKINTLDNFLNSNTVLKSYVKFNPGESGSITFRISIFQNDVNMNNFEYKKFNSNNKYISFGNFIVQRPENNDTKESTDFEAFDYMCKTNKKYVPGIEFPCTYAQLAEDVCNQCGLELGNKNFRNSDKIIEVNPFINNEQCRFVIKQIAKIAFSWARINIDNKLYFDFAVKSNNESSETFSLDNYIDLEKNNKTIPINTIVLKNSNIDTENVTIRNQALIDAYGVERKLIVSEDYFAYNQEIRQDLIQAGEELYGLVYNPIKIKSIGTIYLESNDLIDIKDKKNNSLYTYCFNHTIDYNGTLFDEIESPAMTDTEIKYLHEPDENLDKRRTEIEIDKANQRINIIAENISETEKNVANIQIDVNSIKNTIEQTIDITREAVGIKNITLENCMVGEVLELHIYGNNSVFNRLYVSENLYPAEDLYPYGDSLIEINNKNYKEGINYVTANLDKNDYHYNTGLRQCKSLVVPIEPSRTYTVTKKAGNRFSLGTFTSEPKSLDIANNFVSGENEGKDLTELSIEAGENDNYLVVFFFDGNLDNNLEEMYDSIVIRSGYQLIDLGITDALRQLGEVYDEYELVNNTSRVIRRIGVTESGTLYVLDTPIIEQLGNLTINLCKGTNTIEIVNYSANIKAKYIINNEFTDRFVDTVEFKTTIEALADKINLEVNKKVGNDEIIARINMAILGREDTDIPEDIEKSIIKIIANKISIKSDYTELTPEGHFTTTSADIANWILKNSMLYSNTVINNKKYQSGLDSRINDYFLFAGLDVTDGQDDDLSKSNIYITKSGKVYAKEFRGNAENGLFQLDYDSGRKAMSFNKEGFDWFLDDEANGYIGSIKINNAFIRMLLNDVTGFVINDTLHNNKAIFAVSRIDPNLPDVNPQKYGSLADFYSNLHVQGYDERGLNYTIRIQGYEVLTTASDERLKEKIKKCTDNALEIITNIPIISFYWKKDTHRKDAGKYIKFGYGAQRTKKVFSDGVVQDKETDTYQMNLLNLSALHTKSIQELDIKCKEQQKTIDKQQKVIDFLVNKLGYSDEVKELLT